MSGPSVDLCSCDGFELWYAGVVEVCRCGHPRSEHLDGRASCVGEVLLYGVVVWGDDELWRRDERRGEPVAGAVGDGFGEPGAGARVAGAGAKPGEDVVDVGVPGAFPPVV